MYALSQQAPKVEHLSPSRSADDQYRYSGSQYTAQAAPPVPAKTGPGIQPVLSTETPQSARASLPAPPLQAKPRAWLDSQSGSSRGSNLRHSNPIREFHYSHQTDTSKPLASQEDLLSQDLSSKPATVNPPLKPDTPELGRLQNELLSVLDAKAYALHQETLTRFNALNADIGALQQTESKLNSELAQLSRIEVSSTSNALTLHEKTARAKELVEAINDMGIPNIDECLVAQNVVYNQLYDLVTSNMALQDTLYTLGKALENERINLDTFLKVIEIREVSNAITNKSSM